MRVLALDYGHARCGVAVCDPTETVVTPLAPVLRVATRRGLGRVRALVDEYQAEQVIVGLPLSLRGDDTQQTVETREFAAALSEKLDVPVELHDERLTTRLAQRDPSRIASEDSRAAAHLLEDWLARPERPRLPR